MSEAELVTTVDRLVELAIIYPEKKLKLRTSTYFEYDDMELGNEYERKRDEIYKEMPSYKDQDGRKKVYARLDKHEKTQPAQHAVKVYSLAEGYSDVCRLSQELGEKVETIWTKKPSRYSQKPERVGMLTIAGILKRMGVTDVAEKIVEDRRKKKQQAKVNERNYKRKHITAMLAELEKYVNQNGKEIGVTADMFQLPVELADALKEETI